MIGKSIVNQQGLTNSQAKEYLQKIEEGYIAKSKPLGYELEQSLKYVKKFSKVTPKESAKLIKELTALDLSENVVIELVNIMPKKAETVKAILFKKAKTSDALVENILKILA